MLSAATKPAANGQLDELSDKLGNGTVASGSPPRKIESIDEDEESSDIDLDKALGSGTGIGKGMSAREAAALAARESRKLQKRNNRAVSISENGKFGTNGYSGTGVNQFGGKTAKNSRKSRTGFGRGLPKKRECPLFRSAFYFSIINYFHLLFF